MQDESGNQIFVQNNNILLKLNSEKFCRNIGRLNLQKKHLVCFRNSDKHLFRKGDAYGFNVKVLETAKVIDKVRLIVDSNESFLIPVEDILTKGEYLNFKNNGGFEKQIFLKREIIKNYKEE